MRTNHSVLARVLLPLAGALVLLAVQSPAFAQCSIAAWDGAVGNPQPLGAPAKKYEQSCGLTVDAADFPSYVTTNAPVDETQFSVRFYVLPSDLTMPNGEEVTVLVARDNTTHEVEVRLRSTGDVKNLTAFYRTSNVLTEIGSPIPLQDTWHGVEVAWSAGNGDGTFELKLDNVPKVMLSNLSNDGAVINEVDFGAATAPSAAGALAFDAFDLRRTPTVGLLTINEMFGISTRSDVRTVHEIVIGGFIISGDTDKCVVVRGRGLSVGVPEGETRLADPFLALYSGPDLFESNDDWQDFPEAQTIIDLGMQPDDPSDAAVYTCLPPGPYTAFLYGASGEQGIGIVEMFDADSGTPYLASISTRSFVDTVHKVSIGGFIIDGDQPKEVVIRGMGPSVALPEGVPPLSDPLLGLYDSVGGLVASNDNWQSATNQADISAAGYAPGDPLESVIMMTLTPGAYTAILSGSGGVTGVGLVEVVDKTGSIVAAQ